MFILFILLHSVISPFMCGLIKGFQLHYMFTPTPVVAFGEGGKLRLRFRKTRRHIAALTLDQMCRLFYQKRPSVCSDELTEFRYQLCPPVLLSKTYVNTNSASKLKYTISPD